MQHSLLVKVLSLCYYPHIKRNVLIFGLGGVLSTTLGPVMAGTVEISRLEPLSIFQSSNRGSILRFFLQDVLAYLLQHVKPERHWG